jgi:outer membrane biogenesis lipoprotein LolB
MKKILTIVLAALVMVLVAGCATTTETTWKEWAGEQKEVRVIPSNEGDCSALLVMGKDGKIKIFE